MNQQIKQRIAQLNNGEVPNGYEKTEFGIFPCDWVTDKKLKDLGSFGKGKGLPGEKMTTEGVPCVGYGDIYMKYNHFHFEEAQTFVDEETASESQPIEKGTLLFTGTGETADEIGKCVCYNGDETIYAGGDIITFVSKEVNPLFLAYQQYQEFSLRKKASCGQGHSVVHIQRENLEKLNVAYPKSTEEQSKIAEILMKWDEAIELQEQYIESLKRQKTSIMKTLFQFSNECILTFKDAVKPYKYKKELQTSQYQETGRIPIVDQGKNKIVGYTNDEDYVICPPEKGLLLFGDHTTEVKYIKYDFAVGGDGVKLFEENGLYQLKYVYYYLIAFPFLIEGYKRHYSILKNKPIRFPTVEGKIDAKKMGKIVCVLSQYDEMIDLQIEKIDKTKMQRKTLQQYLLNGIVRV